MMEEAIRAIRINHDTACDPVLLAPFSPAAAEKVIAFHRSFPEYAPTPLWELKDLSRDLGVAGIYVKDESTRFGLNAFKVLGGSHAIGRWIAKTLGEDPADLTCDRLVSDEVRKKLGEVTFVTATDGNHGRGVAWTANRLGQKSVVYMPAGTAQERLDNIRALGADASIPGPGYDDCVRLAAKHARERGWVLTQDTSWEGYEEIPRWIMEGYTTMAAEVTAQLRSVRPTHVILQAGVGSMAGAIAAYLTALYGADRPTILITEPHTANCVFRSAEAGDGKLRTVTGPMPTMMAGLACGEPCPLAWEILRGCADVFFSIPDGTAARGMRALGMPLNADPAIVSGESGASGFGTVLDLLTDPALRSLRNLAGLDSHSRILCFSTEGATDRANYARVMAE